MPKYALANNLYICFIPDELKDLTIVEQTLINRCHVKCTIVKITTESGNNYLNQFKCRWNIITFPQNPDNILDLLASLPKSEDFQVAFIGKIKPSDDYIKKIFTVRKWIIVVTLLWLKQHNAAYSNVTISQDFIDLLPDDEIQDEIKKSFHHIISDDTKNTKTIYDNFFKHFNSSLIYYLTYYR